MKKSACEHVRRAVALLLAVAAGSAALAAQSVAPYGRDRKVVRCGILSGPGLAGLSPYVFYLLGADEVGVATVTGTPSQFPFHPPKPVGWEFVNPVADPTLPGGKSNAGYWTSGLDLTLAPLDENVLRNFDVLLLPVGAGPLLDTPQRRLLAAWVEQGGLLWIDNQSAGADVNLWMEPVALTFRTASAGPASKFAADPTHALLKGVFSLSRRDINLLGSQQIYAASDPLVVQSNLFGVSSGVGIAVLASGTPQLLLQEVVRESDGANAFPSIAAGRFGSGAVVATSCGVARAISAWYQSLQGGGGLGELPEWAIPDMKLAYNMIAWAQTWSNRQGDARGRNAGGGEASAPLSERWRFDAIKGTGERVLSPLSAAVVGGGMVLTGDGGSVVHALDLRPERDLDGDGRSDDGLSDLGEGTFFDEVWAAQLPLADPSGQPLYPVGAATTTYFDSAAGGPRPLAVVAARADTALEGYLLAYQADAAGTPLRSAYWSAKVTGLAPSRGRLASGPVYADGMLIVATTDSTDNPEVPTRDSYVLAYDVPAGPLARTTPAIAIPLASGGMGFELFSPPAVAFLPVRDAPTGESELVETAILAGNALPRIGASATARVVAVPLLLRFGAPSWDQDWNTVQVWVRQAGGPSVMVPVRRSNLPTEPLNFVRRFRGGQIEVFFTRWNIFAEGKEFVALQPAVAPGFEGFEVRYNDTQGATKTLTVQPQAAATSPTNAVIRPGLSHSPCVVGDIVYAGAGSVEAYPNRSVPGNLWAARLDLQEGFKVVWQFFGDQTGGPLKQTGLEFLSDFSAAPAVSGDTLYVAGNYQFTMNSSSLETGMLSGGRAGVLYAIDLKADPALTGVLTGDPVLPGGLAPQAPVGQSADVNQIVQAGTRGAVIWVTTNLTGPEPQDAIPQRTGVLSNWNPDFLNGIVRLGPGVIGKYGGRLLRVQYFPAGSGVVQPAIMRAPRLVKWAFSFASESGGNWEIVSPPVVSNGTVHVMVMGPGGTYICSFSETAAGGQPPDPVWTRVLLPSLSDPRANLAVDGDLLLASASSATGPAGGVVAWANPATVIADSSRIVEVKSENGPASRAPMTYYLYGTSAPGLGAFRQLLRRPPDDVEQPVQIGPGLQAVFVTEPGKPAVDTAGGSTKPGTWRFVFAVDAAADGYIWVNVRKRPQSGPLVAVWEPDLPPIEYPGVRVTASPNPQQVVLDLALPGIPFSADDRIQIEVLASAAMTLHLEGSTFTRVETTVRGPANSQRMNTAAVSAAEYSPRTDGGLLGIPMNQSYADRQLKGFSHPSRARKLPDGNLLVCDTGNNRVVEMDATGQVGWQYPDSDLANGEVAAAYRTATMEAQRLLAPMDAQRFTTAASDFVGGQPVTVEWVTTLMADTGHNRLVEVVRPLVNGAYRPDLVLDSGAATAQTVSVVGPSLGVSRPYYLNGVDDPGGLGYKTLTNAPGADFEITRSADPVVPIASFITGAGEPGLTSLPQGVWAFTVLAVAAPGAPLVDTYLYLKVWRTDTAGAKIGGALGQTTPILLPTGQARNVTMTVAQALPGAFGIDDRVLVEVMADTGGAGLSSVTIYGGNTAGQRSRAHIPFGEMDNQLMITTAARLVDAVGAESTEVMAGLAVHPPDPTKTLWNATGDANTRIVAIAVARTAAGKALGAVLARGDGVNLFKPRAGMPRDFVHVRQAERVVLWNSLAGKTEEHALVVDDDGVKHFRADTWNEVLAPVFEVTTDLGARNPTITAAYRFEMQTARQWYADSDSAGGRGLDWAKDTAFFPAGAQLLSDGSLLIANCQAAPVLPAGSGGAAPDAATPTSAMAALKSEVLEVDPKEPAGNRILRRDGSYFIAPDPFSVAHPGIAGTRSGLSQPLSVSR